MDTIRYQPSLSSALLWGLLVLLGPSQPSAGATEELRIISASTRLVDRVYRLDADIAYQLSPDPLEAVENGVPIVFELKIVVERSRNWLPDETVATLLQQYRFKYHALTKLYLVTNLNSGERASFRTRESALRAMGRVRNLPLIDESLLQPDQRYQVRLKVGLDIEALPAPLRLMAYVSPEWWRSSDWFSWQL